MVIIDTMQYDNAASDLKDLNALPFTTGAAY